MVEAGEVRRDGSVTLLFETGGDVYSIGGPDVMELELDVHGGRVVRARISHSLVEILATGCLWIGLETKQPALQAEQQQSTST